MGLLGGRGEAGDARLARVRFDLRKRRRRRYMYRAGRLPTEFRPGVRRAILDLHAQGVGYREICRRLKLGVSYGTVRRVVREIMEAARLEAARPRTIGGLMRECDPGLLRRLRRGGVKLGARTFSAEALEAAARDEVVADLLREDRRGIWDRMLDASPES